MYKIITAEESLNILKDINILGIDTETSGLDVWTKKLLLVQIGNKEHQVVIDTTTVDITLYRDLLEDKSKLQIYWNAKFDLKWLYKYNIFPHNIWDGYVVEALFHLGYPPGKFSLSLKTAGSKYCNVDLDKSVRGKIIGSSQLTEEIIEYAANDVVYLEEIMNKQKEIAMQNKMIKAVNVENKFVIPLAYMEYCGIKLDCDKWKAKMVEDKKLYDQRLSTLNNWVLQYYKDNKSSKRDGYVKKEWVLQTMGDNTMNMPPTGSIVESPPKWVEKPSGTFYICYLSVPFPFIFKDLQGDLFKGFQEEPQCIINWNSSDQVIPLFNFLGINTRIFDKKENRWKDSVEAKQLKPQKKDFPIIPIYLQYSESQKVCSTYGQNFLDQINPVSGRIHTDYKQLGTFTTRISSGGSDKYENIKYVNLLNLPSDAITRACFKAESGNKFISIDYSGQESVLMASLANDKEMIKELTVGSKDLHSLTAYLSFTDQIPRDTNITEIKHKYHDLRQAAKGIEFAINYGGSAHTIQENSGFSKEEAETIYKSYMKGFYGLAEYQAFRRRDWLNKGYFLLSSELGYKCNIPDIEEIQNMNYIMNNDPSFWDRYRQAKKDPNNPFYIEVKEFFKKKSDYEKKSINYPIQFTGSMCCRFSMLYFFEWLRDNNLLNIVKIVVAPYDVNLSQ